MGILYGGFKNKRYTSINGFCFFKPFLMVGKGLSRSALHLSEGLIKLDKRAGPSKLPNTPLVMNYSKNVLETRQTSS